MERLHSRSGQSVTIPREGHLTLIECRLTKKRQDVKWIEELIGRRQSLGAQTVIAVASAGFTSGAQKKAARYGLLLRDLRRLSDEDIQSWGGGATLTLYYYQYSDVTLAVRFPHRSVHDLDPAVVGQELRCHAVLQSLFNAVADQLDRLKLLAKNETRMVALNVLVQPENVRLCGQPVLEIGIAGKARLVKQSVSSGTAFKYGDPTKSAVSRDTTIERFTLGETSIVHDSGRVAINLDLSEIELPPLCQIRYFSTSWQEEVECEIFSITNPGAVRVRGPLTVTLYALKSDSNAKFPLSEGMIWKAFAI
jgi:Restriction endonuclease